MLDEHGVEHNCESVGKRNQSSKFKFIHVSLYSYELLCVGLLYELSVTSMNKYLYFVL